MQNERRLDGSSQAKATLLLAHGAGAGMDSPFMEAITTSLAQRGWRVVRFEFPYMQRQRSTGKKAPPDRADRLLNHFREEVNEQTGPAPLFIGGKSMGGRVASLLADELFHAGRLRGCVCLGYPFHPLGKPDTRRIEHLQGMAAPVLIVQGERDAMGRREEVEGYPLAPTVQLAWMPDGDHSLKPRQRSGRTEAMNLDLAAESVDHFLRKLL